MVVSPLGPKMKLVDSEAFGSHYCGQGGASTRHFCPYAFSSPEAMVLSVGTRIKKFTNFLSLCTCSVSRVTKSDKSDWLSVRNELSADAEKIPKVVSEKL